MGGGSLKEKCLERVNHDILMSWLARHVDDERVLKRILRLSGSGSDALRGRNGTKHGHAARRALVAAAVEHPAYEL